MLVFVKVIRQQQGRDDVTRTLNEKHQMNTITNLYKDLITEWKEKSPCTKKCGSLLDQLKVYLEFSSLSAMAIKYISRHFDLSQRL